jgi:hypothetical protein
MSDSDNQGKARSGEYALSFGEAARALNSELVAFTVGLTEPVRVDTDQMVRRMMKAKALYLSDRYPGMEMVLEEERGRVFLSTNAAMLAQIRESKPAVPSGRRLVMAAFSCDDRIVGPTFASLALSGIRLQRIRELAALCDRHDLKAVRATVEAMNWGPASTDTMRLYDSTVVVDRRDVWFEDHLAGTDVGVQTAACALDALERWWFDGDGDLFVADDLGDLRNEYEGSLAEAA